MTAPDVADWSEPDRVDDPVRINRERPGLSAADRSPLTGLLWALASIPVAALVLLGSMAVRVRLGDGAWPVRNQPDPKELGIHNTATVVMILASFAAVVAVPLLTIVLARARTRRLPIGPLVLSLGGFIILVGILRADVAGLGDWIGD